MNKSIVHMTYTMIQARNLTILLNCTIIIVLVLIYKVTITSI